MDEGEQVVTMKRLLMLLALVFIHSTYAGSFAQTNIKSEFVNLKTDDGITLHGALWESTRPGSARGSRAESLLQSHSGTRPEAHPARVQNL